MANQTANHFVVFGAGIEGSVDLEGVDGSFLADLSVDGRALRTTQLERTRQGIVVTAIHEEVPDDHTLVVSLTLPEVNVDGDALTCAGLAVLTTQRTSLTGPAGVSGALNLYQFRPLAVVASVVESLQSS